MTRSEALMYFPEGDDLEDIYEEKLFEWKNFFVNRFPVRKLFASKLATLDLHKEAYAELGGEEESGLFDLPPVSFTDDLLENFTRYSQHRNLLKARLFAAVSFDQIKQIAEALLSLTLEYAQAFAHDTEVEVEVRLSIEPDPMELLEALRRAKELGVSSKKTVEQLPENHLVRSEAKRLSLWLKSNGNG